MRRASAIQFAKKILAAFALTISISSFALAQDHKWAGRTLDDREWAIHEKLAAIPSHGVFDTLRYEVQGNTVILSGMVVRDSARQGAERVVRGIDGVENVVNTIEVLPASRRDDALRRNVYRAIYEKDPTKKYAGRPDPTIHIIVKDGWVTLEGVVDSDADRSVARLHALKVTAHVSDNLRVVSPGN